MALINAMRVMDSAGVRHLPVVEVGFRGRGGLPGMLGSTSQSLLCVAPCPLAIVRH